MLGAHGVSCTLCSSRNSRNLSLRTAPLNDLRDPCRSIPPQPLPEQCEPRSIFLRAKRTRTLMRTLDPSYSLYIKGCGFQLSVRAYQSLNSPHARCSPCEGCEQSSPVLKLAPGCFGKLTTRPTNRKRTCKARNSHLPCG